MKKICFSLTLVAIICMLTCPGSAFAIGPKIGFGVDMALPSGDFGDAAGTGFGASARVEKGNIIPGLGFTLTAGYIQFGEEKILGIDYKYSMIPVQVGAKYSLIGTGLYGIVEAGVHIVSIEVLGESESETKFGIAPGVGFSKPIGPGLSFDVSAKYQHVSGEKDFDFQYFGIHAGVVLGI